MIKNLFTKRDHRNITGITKEQVMNASGLFWRSRQFGVNFVSPYVMQGEQFYSKLGLKQSVVVTAMDEGAGTGIDLQISAGLTDTGTVVGVIGAIVVLPVAAAVGAVSYIEYENDAQRLMNEFWSYVHSYPKDAKPPPPAALPKWAEGQQPAQTPPAASGKPPATCPKCAAPVDADSVFCKHCGAKL
jgi:hypothetical protein